MASRQGSRPWGYWRFVLGEEMPQSKDAERLRPIELGELTDEERVP
jgi:hypothetical protein